MVPDGDRVAITPLTVGFRGLRFLTDFNMETWFTLTHGFWPQLSQDERREAKLQRGPTDSQLLNRYAYVVNRPLTYTDPSGHELVGSIDFGYEQDLQTNTVSLWVNEQEIVYDLDLVDIPTYDLIRRFTDAVDDYEQSRVVALLSAFIGVATIVALPAQLAFAEAAVTADLASGGPKLVVAGCVVVIVDGIVVVAAAATAFVAWGQVEATRADGNRVWVQLQDRRDAPGRLK